MLGVELGKGTAKPEPLDTIIGANNSGTLSYHKLRELKITERIDGWKEGT